jgi:hypothetical protein
MLTQMVLSTESRLGELDTELLTLRERLRGIERHMIPATSAAATSR